MRVRASHSFHSSFPLSLYRARPRDVRSLARPRGHGALARSWGLGSYLSQSLPFGGCGQSGFDRFAGPEGLRGLTMPRAVREHHTHELRTDKSLRGQDGYDSSFSSLESRSSSVARMA